MTECQHHYLPLHEESLALPVSITHPPLSAAASSSPSSSSSSSSSPSSSANVSRYSKRSVTAAISLILVLLVSIVIVLAWPHFFPNSSSSSSSSSSSAAHETTSQLASPSSSSVPTHRLVHTDSSNDKIDDDNDESMLVDVMSLFEPTEHGIRVSVQTDDHSVELAVEGENSFRISLAYDGNPASALTSQSASRIIDTHSTFADFKQIQFGDFVGIATSFGSLLINPLTNSLLFRDAQGNNLTSSSTFSSYSGPSPHPPSPPPPFNACSTVFDSTDQSGGSRTPSHPNAISNSDTASCCDACNHDTDCTFWVLDPSGKLCYLLMNVQQRVQANNRISGGKTSGGAALIVASLENAGTNLRLYGAGGGAGAGLVSTSSNPYVTNTAFQVPYFYASSGFSSLAVSPLDYDPSNVAHFPAAWSSSSSSVTWSIQGQRVDLYLWPSSSAKQSVSSLWELTGRPRVLPRYAFGFAACRWGWTDSNYIQSILTQFRNGNYPIDSFISDFEWFTSTPDYNLPSQGSSTYVDFSYNPTLFPQPQQQLSQYHSQYHVRFGGIRKPRLGNSDLISMAQSKGWLLQNAPRNFNYSQAAVRDYYATQIAHFLPDGVDYWWNDEGETAYFTFHDWNTAQQQALTTYDSKKRFLTVNRAFTLGMQKMGLVIWSGDISVSWQSLQQTPQYLLAWGLAGVPFFTCDIGGFNGGDTPSDLLVRWYEVGTFLGMFRVHSTQADTPHFPFLYDATSASYMKQAMNWRYQLLPHLYSLAHQQYADGELLLRPLLFEFPTDSAVYTLNTEWMVGSSLLVSPVLQQDNSVNVYLPGATWFEYGSTTTHVGPTTLSLTNVPLSHTPVFVRAGSLLMLAPSGLQYTDALPGGPLQIQIYAGADATFTLVEDDGTTRNYESGAVSDVRRTTFVWNDSKRTLSWSVPANSFSDSHTFTTATATAYFAGAGAAKTLPQQTLGQQGSFQF